MTNEEALIEAIRSIVKEEVNAAVAEIDIETQMTNFIKRVKLVVDGKEELPQ